MDNIKIFFSLVTVLLIFSTIEAVDKKRERLIIHEIVTTMYENDYIKDVKISVHDRDVINVEAKIVKDIPDEATMYTAITFNGMDLPEQEKKSLCVVLEDELMKSDIKDYFFPKDKFPKECPINAMDYKVGIEEYEFPHHKIPDYIPPGPVTVNMTIEFGDQMWVKVDGAGVII